MAPRGDLDQLVAIKKLGAVFVAVIERPFAEQASNEPPRPPRLLSSRDAQLPLDDLTPLFRLTPSCINDNRFIPPFSAQAGVDRSRSGYLKGSQPNCVEALIAS